MKRLITILLLSGIAIIHGNAQNRIQLLSDVKATMQDFSSDLNNVIENRKELNQNVGYLADTYGWHEYFIYNGTFFH